MEYFVDQEKYFYWIILYLGVAVCIGATALIGIGSLLIAYAQHTCGMFRISRYETNIELNTKFRILNKILFYLE